MNFRFFLSALLALSVNAFPQEKPAREKAKAPPTPPAVPTEATRAETPKPAAAVTPANDMPAQVASIFFGLLQKNQIDPAYEGLMKGSKIAERPEELKTLKSKTKEAIDVFGPIQNYELVETKNVGTRLLRRTYLSLNKEFPLRWRFYFYLSDNLWRLIDLRVDDRVTGMFDEVEELKVAPENKVSAEPGLGALPRLLRFIRFSHTVFALPFALGSMLVAARGLPPTRTIVLIIFCMVFARTAAMLFNRLADWRIDQRNPRTADRHRLISRGAAACLLVASSAAFVATTWWINWLCFLLSPIALVIVFFYSVTKRFTAGSHLFLGLALSVSPVGAWLAVTGGFALAPLVLALAVLFWVAGFDLIYATQDYEFDRREGLRSMVVTLGIERSLQWAQRLHWTMFVVLAVFGWIAQLRAGFAVSLALIAGALLYEHRHAASRDIAAINRAFFWSNAFVGVAFLAGVLFDCVASPNISKSNIHSPLAAPDSFDGARAGEEREVGGVKFCWCPPGRFRMGSPRNEPERRPGENQVDVILWRGFWIGKYEVTQSQWRQIVGEFPGKFTAGEGDDYPVYTINFAEAEAFCRKLTERAHASGELPQHWEFRLPTEAQWEYACRAGTTTATSFGDKLSSRQANFQGKPYNGAEAGPSLKRAVRVGSYPANPWGLHDMHGNVFEWCRDWFRNKLPGGVDPDLYTAKDSASRSEHGGISRVRRGGCWADEGWPCRSAFRLRFEPERRHDHIGFRVVAVLPAN